MAYPLEVGGSSHSFPVRRHGGPKFIGCDLPHPKPGRRGPASRRWDSLFSSFRSFDTLVKNGKVKLLYHANSHNFGSWVFGHLGDGIYHQHGFWPIIEAQTNTQYDLPHMQRRHDDERRCGPRVVLVPILPSDYEARDEADGGRLADGAIPFP